MAIELKYNIPINLLNNELRNAVVQNLATAPTGIAGLVYYDTTLHGAYVYNGTTWRPFDAALLTDASIPNAALANPSLVLGSTSLVLGTTTTTIAGLTSVTSTTFVGALTGNATTATTLFTPRTIGTTGITSTAATFDGSSNVNIAVTAVPTSLLTGTLAASQFPALTGVVTTTAGSLVTTITSASVTNTMLANPSLTLGSTTLTLGSTTTTISGLTINGVLTSVTAAVSAAGTTQGTATALTSDTNVVTAVAAGSGVTLPAALTGKVIVVHNTGANPLLIYPAGTNTIDLLSASAAITLPVNGVVKLFGISSTQWFSTFNYSINTNQLIGTITNSQLVNSAVTIGTSSVSLGSAITTIAGLTSVTSTTFVGALTGNATNVTGVVAIANGGTGQTTALAGYDALAPTTTLGDITYRGASTSLRLPGNITTTKQFLVQTGTGSASAAPAWGSISVSDVPILNQNTTGSAATLTTPRTIALSGSATGTPTSFNGSADITISVTSVDLTSATGSTTASHISDLSTTVKAYTLDSFAAPIAALNINGQLLNNVATAISGTDAVNLNQLNAAVATAASGIDPKEAVNAATTANITLSGAQTIDGVSIVAGNRVLVKNQTTASENGIYLAATGAWTRTTDGSQGYLTSGAMMLVLAGTVNNGTQWYLTTPDPITVGTTSLSFIQFGAGSSYTFTSGLTVSGSVISVGQGTGIIVGSTTVSIDTTLVARKYSVLLSTSATSYTVTHNLGTKNVTVTIMNTSTGDIEMTYVTVPTVNTVTIGFSTAPTANVYQVTVVG